MADLSLHRLAEAPRFTYCEVDMFGPFVIKQQRNEIKHYGAIFTCMASRAVHTEVTHSLNKDSFIQVLRRLIVHRGNIKVLYSDNGTNFVKCANEMKKAYKEMDNERIQSFMQSVWRDLVSWVKNPPAASHMSGVWEMQIRSACAILSSLLSLHWKSLGEESLLTLVAELERILNSWPLTVETISNPTSGFPLAPSNILTMKLKVVMSPPRDFSRPDLYCQKRWRCVQHIANEFWSRWRKAYLQSLQAHIKWQDGKRNFSVAVIVLVVQDESVRNQWPMARVIQVFKDSNGYVWSVKLKTGKTRNSDEGDRFLERPVSKVVLVLEQECVRFPNEEVQKG